MYWRFYFTRDDGTHIGWDLNLDNFNDPDVWFHPLPCDKSGVPLDPIPPHLMREASNWHEPA